MEARYRLSPPAGLRLLLRPGRAVAGAHVHQVELRIERQRVPGRAAAAGLPVLAARIPGLGRARHRVVLERLARVAGHGEPAPFLVAGVRIVGGDVAAHAVLGATVADDDLALEHPRRAGDGVGARAVDDRVFLPHRPARGRIERDQPSVVGADEHLALMERHAPVDHVAAALVAGFARDLRIERPDPLAGADVDGVHDAPRGRHVHDPIHHQRGRLDAAGRFEVVRPHQAQILDVGRVDLAQLAEARLGVVQPVARPVGRLGRVGPDECAIHPLGHRRDVLAGPLGGRAALSQGVPGERADQGGQGQRHDGVRVSGGSSGGMAPACDR